MCRVLTIVTTILLAASPAFAQTTGFTYQGRLTASGTPATGLYDLQFGLWDAQASGTQIGSLQNINGVQVTSGVFTVTLDFGANAFNGANRFLQISARPAGSGSFTTLSPRQQITSTPYAVRSLNAATADNVPASGVPAGSANYIQNTSSAQSGNFNISGNATAGGTMSGGIVNATTQYNLNGSRILSNLGFDNFFAGVGSGQSNTGTRNSFFGFNAGNANTAGTDNSFLGSRAGLNNTIGSQNAFFGTEAGRSNTTGSENTFFGHLAGLANTSGSRNSFFGADTGRNGLFEGYQNTFIGYGAGGSETHGISNTLLGALTGYSEGVEGSTAIGFGALVTQSNSLVLGGFGLSTSVGIGTTAPQAPLHIQANQGNILFFGDAGCGSGFAGISFHPNLSGCTNYALLGGAASDMIINRPLGRNIIFREGNGPNHVEIRPGGTVGIGTLGTGGSTGLCLNSIRAISQCSSSLRYKTEVRPFSSGLQLINRLQPVSFNWKSTHQPDIGLIAEEVAKVEPRLTFKNQNDEVEGVNYSQLTAVLINAVKEQQAQIKMLLSANAALNKRVQSLERRLRQKAR